MEVKNIKGEPLKGKTIKRVAGGLSVDLVKGKVTEEGWIEFREPHFKKADVASAVAWLKGCLRIANLAEEDIPEVTRLIDRAFPDLKEEQRVTET